MDKTRPQSREKYITDNSAGVQKRGAGLDTGPVGSGSAFQSGSGAPHPVPHPASRPAPRPGQMKEQIK